MYYNMKKLKEHAQSIGLKTQAGELKIRLGTYESFTSDKRRGWVSACLFSDFDMTCCRTKTG